MQYLKLTIEVAWPCDTSTDIGQQIQSALDDLRSEGAAKAMGYMILEEDGYQEWYKQLGIDVVIIPSPTIVRFDQ